MHKLTGLAAVVKSFVQHVARARRGNVAMIFAIVLVPVLLTGGAGIDLARAMAVRTKLYAAVDAAALAVASKNGINQAQAEVLAQQYFNANYKLNNSFGAPEDVTVNLAGQSVTVSTQSDMPTTLMSIAGFEHVNLTASSNVVWGQTRIWVGLALDNTGSMCQTDTNPNAPSPCPNPPANSKIAALKTATHALLNKFQSVAANPGDVQVSLIPFSKVVNVGADKLGETWLDWTDWEAPPPNYLTLANGGAWSDYGPNATNANRRRCPWTNNNNGFKCLTTSSNNASTYNDTDVIATGTFCPSRDNGSRNAGRGGRSYNGCFNSVPTVTTNTTPTTVTTNNVQFCGPNSSCTTANQCGGYPFDSPASHPAPTNWTRYSNCACSGSGNNRICRRTTAVTTYTTTTTTGAPYTHTWTPNLRVTWEGCIMDRTQSYDTTNTTPGGAGTLFPTENSSACVPTTMSGNLNYNWGALSAKVDAMAAAGNTNQTIGLAWAWQSMTGGNPLNAPSLPANTSRYIIILSDGENTQNRWSSNRAAIDARMNTLCTNAKNDDIIVWTVFVNIAGGAGNAQSMKDCATGGANGGHYIEVTSSGGIGTAFDVISQQITNLRVAH